MDATFGYERDKPYVWACREFVRMVLGDGPASQQYWEQVLPSDLISKFKVCTRASIGAERCNSTAERFGDVTLVDGAGVAAHGGHERDRNLARDC